MHADDTVDVQYDDGDFECRIPLGCVRPAGVLGREREQAYLERRKEAREVATREKGKRQRRIEDCDKEDREAIGKSLKAARVADCVQE